MQILKVSLSNLPEPLKNLLRIVSRRLRWQVGVRLALPALSLGLLATLVLLLLGRFYPLAFPLVLLAIGLSLTLLALEVVLLYAWFRPQSLLGIARHLDHRLDLEERLSTALELAAVDHNIPPAITQAQLTDTLVHLQTFEPAHTFPLRLSRPWLALSGLLVIAIAVAMLAPNPQVQVLQQRAKTEEIIEEQKAQLEAIRAELLADETLLETPQGEALRQSLDELLETLRENNLSPEETLAALSQAEQELAGLQDGAAQQAANLDELAQTFGRFDSTADLAEALRQRDLARAAEALASAGNNLSTNPETGQELAEALRQAAQAAQQAGNNDLAESLNQAAAAVEQAATQAGDAQAAQEALARAAQELAAAGEQLTNQEAVAEALSNIQEAREQLAQANGQAGSGQAQQAGQGRGQGQQGQGAGTASAQGSNVGGAGRGDPGPGAQGLAAEQGAPDRMATDNGPNQGHVGEYESLYAPAHLGGEGGPIVKPDQQDVQSGLPVGEAPIDPNQDPGAALIPYDQVYGQYQDAASQALDSGYIPLGMKGYIRQYFGALEPGE